MNREHHAHEAVRNCKSLEVGHSSRTFLTRKRIEGSRLYHVYVVLATGINATPQPFQFQPMCCGCGAAHHGSSSWRREWPHLKTVISVLEISVVDWCWHA